MTFFHYSFYFFRYTYSVCKYSVIYFFMTLWWTFQRA